MNESVIIHKLIQVGQMLERGELEYSGAEADTKHYLEQYAALRQPHVVGLSEQLIAFCRWYNQAIPSYETTEEEIVETYFRESN